MYSPGKITVVLVLVGLSVILTKPWWYRHPLVHTESFHKDLHEELELSKHQKRAIESLEAEFEEEQRQLGQQISKGEQTLSYAVLRKSSNIKELSLNLNRLKTELHVTRVQHYADLLEYLTMQQKEKFWLLCDRSLSTEHSDMPD